MSTAIRHMSTEEVAAQSKKLMDEFWQHLEGINAKPDEQHDPNLVFQAWAIQKIASLQLLTLELARSVSGRTAFDEIEDLLK